jgi:hypothetical protein
LRQSDVAKQRISAHSENSVVNARFWFSKPVTQPSSNFVGVCRRRNLHPLSLGDSTKYFYPCHAVRALARKADPLAVIRSHWLGQCALTRLLRFAGLADGCKVECHIFFIILSIFLSLPFALKTRRQG